MIKAIIDTTTFLAFLWVVGLVIYTNFIWGPV